MTKISIIIRTKNEDKYLPQVLQKLKAQSFQDFEIIIVDDSSTDKTLEIAKKYNCEIVNLEKGKFNYPYACNVGAQNSEGEYLLYLSGHSIPITKNFLEDGLTNFEDKKVAGVYGILKALPDANLFEKFFYNIGSFFSNKRKVIDKLKDAGMGVLGFTNAMIRKELWEKYNINEEFAGGGEDGDWAKHWIKEGYKIIHDPKFKVYHSHNLGLIGLIKQYVGWMGKGKATKFKSRF
jgi:glycosyltransferase involved in cell wall biosynthesis